MSTLKVNKIRDTSGSADAITLDPSGGAVLAGVTTISTARITTGITTSIQVGGGVTISESGIEASGIGITCANINGAAIGGRRNILINGAMQVAQRGTSTSGSFNSSAVYGTADRWRFYSSNTDQAVYSLTLPSEAPTGQGFARSWKLDISTAETTLDSDELVYFTQILEGQDLQQLRSGTSSAKPMTLSFWVKAYQAGTYCVTLYKADQTARGVTFNYTINASATWEFKTITIPGDTGGGGIDNDNGAGIYVHWALASGSNYTSSDSIKNSWANYNSAGFAHGQTVNIVSSTDNYWQITGVQLELGDQATAFEHRSFGDELLLCQRYYFDVVQASGTNETFGFTGAVWQENNGSIIHIRYPVQMRATPTFGSTNGTQYWRYFAGNDISTAYLDGNGLVYNLTKKYGGELYAYLSSGTGAIGRTSWLRANDTSAKAYYSAEL